VRPTVIAVAITGSVPRKRDNPAVPITPQEQIESTHEAFEAGATLVHIHVRNDDETSSSDPDRFALVQEGVKRHCPGMIIQFSTGGRGRYPSARGSSLYLQPRYGVAFDGFGQFSNYRLRESRGAGRRPCRKNAR
jgi:3-keto-5-aminohexanoate cleavage enzyme